MNCLVTILLLLTVSKCAFFRELGRWYDSSTNLPDASLETLTVDPIAQKVWGSNGGSHAADVFNYTFDINNNNQATIIRTEQVVLTRDNCTVCANGTAWNEPTDI